MQTTGLIPDTDVLVFQMGKVASKSVYHSLLTNGVRATHTHKHVRAAQWLATCRTEGRTPIVITGFRDLLRRNISEFFFNMSNPGAKSWYMGDAAYIETVSTEQLITEFNQRHLRHHRNAARKWVERFVEVIGVDPCAEPFPHEHGFHVLNSDPPVAIYRAENLSGTFSSICHRLCLPGGPLIRRNDSADAGYAGRYQAFIEAYRPDSDTIAMVYDNPLMRHFYSGAEIDQFIRAWRKS